jgi:hypothetical protein
MSADCFASSNNADWSETLTAGFGRLRLIQALACGSVSTMTPPKPETDGKTMLSFYLHLCFCREPPGSYHSIRRMSDGWLPYEEMKFATIYTNGNPTNLHVPASHNHSFSSLYSASRVRRYSLTQKFLRKLRQVESCGNGSVIIARITNVSLPGMLVESRQVCPPYEALHKKRSIK